MSTFQRGNNSNGSRDDGSRDDGSRDDGDRDDGDRDEGGGAGGENREFREPLHQPPDSQDLAAAPPTSAACALVRGQVRDFVDGDLTALQAEAVEQHVHGCRTCGLALARAEHERLRLQRAFASIARDERTAARAAGQKAVGPRPGFAARVVDRLVLDETSLVSREMLAAAAAQAKAQAAAAARPSPSKPSVVRASGGTSPKASVGGMRGTYPLHLSLAGALVAAAMLLVMLFVGSDFWLEGDRQPEPSDRLVVTYANNVFSGMDPVLLGAGLGNGKTLWVPKDGKARASLYDTSPKVQPAAEFELSNSGKILLLAGKSKLLVGTLGVTTARPVTILLADGSIELGVGEYQISVEEEDALRRGRDPRDLLGTDLPGEWRNGVEVLSGASALIVRAGQPSVVVSAGKIGVFRTDGPVDVANGPNSPATPLGSGPNRDPIVVPEPVDALLLGQVFERSGVPAFGSSVLVSFASSGTARLGGASVEASGTFKLPTGRIGSPSVCDSPFAILQVTPPANRPELGMLAPDAFLLNYANNVAQLATSPVLDGSEALAGTVVDDAGILRPGVRVIPCVIDELFHSALAWPDGQVETDSQGGFRLSRLPVSLPSHQHLAVLLLHPLLAPTVVPVPVRSNYAARTFEARLAAPRLRPVRLEGLPASSDLQVLEDVAGLPPGSAMVRRSVHTDAQGRVASLGVGGGRLWLLRNNSASQNVRELVLDTVLATPVYRFAGSPPVPFESTFLPMQQVPGGDVSLASSFRFERFSTSRSGGPNNGISVQVFGAVFERPQFGAQVFAVHTSGPRGLSGSRFLGFTSGTGELTVDLAANEVGLVVIGPDGSSESVAVTPAVQASGDGVSVLLRANGRILLDPLLRPNPESGQSSVATIRFDPATPSINGLRPSVVRFASALTGWEVSGVPPGEYRAVINDHAYPVEVPANGYVVLH